jgi:cytosine/adenosine deaminase-related metal-dependent hydrolase
MASGLANAHTHIYSALVPFGMPPPKQTPLNFPEILSRVWWRLDRALDEASLAASARLYAAEALLAGTSTLVDHHESPEFIEGSLDVIADGCADVGVRAVLCYGATERNGGAREAERGLRECRRFIETNRRRGIRGVVGLHASFTVSDETIRSAARLCADLATVMHVHVAEDPVDVEDAVRRGHAGPLERLLSLGALPPGSIIAHGVHLSAGQIARAEDAGCWIVQNPRSNRTNRVGYPRALRQMPRAAIGTDGFPSDMLAERQALFEVGLEAGDDVLDLDRRCVGSVRLAAELFDDPIEAPADRDVARWMAGRVRAARERLEVDSRVVCENGALVTADIGAIREDARQQAERLWKRLPPEGG